MKLEGKVAVVTGGAQGIGRAIAAGLAAEGARVAIADLQGAEAAAAAISAATRSSDGPPAIGIACDVSREEDVARMADAVAASLGGIDILVNNAGIYSSLVPGPFEAIEPDAFRRVLDVNVVGVFLCCRAVVPHMRRRGGGRIVNINSGTPFKGVPYLLHYVTSKGAILALTRALAKELGSAGVLVNGVAPGFTLSDGVQANPVQIEKLREISANARTLVRDQFPEDIVGAALFFAGPDSAFITGQTLVVDGGAYFH